MSVEHVAQPPDFFLLYSMNSIRCWVGRHGEIQKLLGLLPSRDLEGQVWLDLQLDLLVVGAQCSTT